MENENGSPISFFCGKEKRKTEITFVFYFPTSEDTWISMAFLTETCLQSIFLTRLSALVKKQMLM